MCRSRMVFRLPAFLLLPCQPLAGTAVTILEQTGTPTFLSKVKINDGQQGGLVG